MTTVLMAAREGVVTEMNTIASDPVLLSFLPMCGWRCDVAGQLELSTNMTVTMIPSEKTRCFAPDHSKVIDFGSAESSPTPSRSQPLK